MQTENTYVETDLGNIALNLRGEYSDETSYEYLDTVSYKGGSYVCLAELAKTTSGIAPEPGKNTEHWQMLALPGGLTSDYIAMHDDVVNKAKQVETSRTAVELSQQEVEAAQADVSQMWQDTQEASEEAAASRDSAAGYAQSAEASRTAAAESEQNINAQVTGFDTHVAEKTSAAESAIIEARQTAVNTVSAKQGDAVQAVTGEGNKQIKNVEDAGTEQVGKVKSAGASAVSTAGAAGVSAVNAVKTQQTASIKVVADKGTQQVTAVNTAGSTQASIIETKGADQVKAIQEAGENALQNISNGVDKGLSEEGKAADAKATGEAISKLTEDLVDSLGYKYYNLEPLWTKGAFYNRDGSLESDSHASYTEIEVKVGEKYHIVGYNAYHLSLYSLRDSNKNKITTYPDSSDTNHEKRKFDEYITIPEGVKYLCVSKWDSFGEMLVEKQSYAKVTDIDAKVTDIDAAAIEEITEFYQIGNDTMEVGWVYTDKRVNDTGETSTARHLTINNIIGGGTYRYTANGGGNCHAVLWFDDTDSPISYVPFSKAWVQETVEVTAPANAVKAIVNSINTSKGELVFEYFGLIRIVKSNPIIEKRVTELEDGTIFEHENIKKRVIENQIKNDFAWKEFDGLYATITFDDTNADIDQLQDLSEELGIPFCYATIPSKLENIMSQGTETAKQVLERAVANGGEVLSHWGPQLNSLSKDEDYYNVYAGAKKTLTENGFEVNGIITAGGGADGTPESFKTQNFLKDIELARIYYKYADLTANDFVSGQDLRYIEQFYNNRTFIDGGVDATKSIIDSMALSGKGWLNLASHGTNNANTPTIDSFRQIFQYAIDKGFTFVTWNTIYEKFKSSKLEKRVKALELN